MFDGLRKRIVEYSKNYLADYWDQKNHIIYCLEGSFISKMKNEESILLTKGMNYVVSDTLSSYRSFYEDGTKLLIIDGNFLKPLPLF